MNDTRGIAFCEGKENGTFFKVVREENGDMIVLEQDWQTKCILKQFLLPICKPDSEYISTMSGRVEKYRVIYLKNQGYVCVVHSSGYVVLFDYVSESLLLLYRAYESEFLYIEAFVFCSLNGKLSTFLTSEGFNCIYKVEGILERPSRTTIIKTEAKIIQLLVYKNFLYGVQIDGSVGVWECDSGKSCGNLRIVPCADELVGGCVSVSRSGKLLYGNTKGHLGIWTLDSERGPKDLEFQSGFSIGIEVSSWISHNLFLLGYNNGHIELLSYAEAIGSELPKLQRFQEFVQGSINEFIPIHIDKSDYVIYTPYQSQFYSIWPINKTEFEIQQFDIKRYYDTKGKYGTKIGNVFDFDSGLYSVSQKIFYIDSEFNIYEFSLQTFEPILVLNLLKQVTVLASTKSDFHVVRKLLLIL